MKKILLTGLLIGMSHLSFSQSDSLSNKKIKNIVNESLHGYFNTATTSATGTIKLKFNIDNSVEIEVINTSDEKFKAYLNSLSSSIEYFLKFHKINVYVIKEHTIKLNCIII